MADTVSPAGDQQLQLDRSAGHVSCPACDGTEVQVAHRHSVAAAAEHLVPAVRDKDRNERLRAELQVLFGGDHVEVCRCGGCGFWFANPFVAGTPEVYNLITEGHELYPSDRFEFELTIRSLPAGPIDLLEIGAGDGAFLRKAVGAGHTGRICATEYDDGALASIARIPGVNTFRGSPQEFAATGPGTFDAVCLFQVLEHMDRVDEVFAALRELTAPGGQLFIGVPNDANVTAQEELTGFWEMPPNHIGRWSRPALECVASRHGFSVLDHRYEPSSAFGELWEFAKCRCQARAYRPSTVAGRVNALPIRWIRGPMKRVLAGWDLLVLSRYYGRIPPRCQWFRLSDN